MSRTLDLLANTTIHGTVAGYRVGCRGSHCPSTAPCRDVYIRYVGDFGFARRVDAGETPEAIFAEERAAAEDVRRRDKAAAREERRRADGEHQQREARKQREKTGQTARPKQKPKPKPKAAPRARRVPDRVRLRDEVTRLHAEGMRDVDIAQRLNSSASMIGLIRRDLGLPRVLLAPRPKAPSARTIRLDRIRELNEAGKTDREIAEEVGMSHRAATQARARLGLQPVRPKREPKSKPPKRSRWEGVELAGHGTNARYARGCRCEPCHTAHREYHREYTKRRRAEGAREYHGTAYGYQLGCRARSECPGDVSCTDAMLAQERERRRAAGIPPKELVDAGPMQAHVADLVRAGMTIPQVAEASGIAVDALRKMIHSRGKERGLVREVLAERAAAILSVPIPKGKAA